ncbi:MAG: P1 family peptidase [Steroidobacteraceae bacterium]
MTRGDRLRERGRAAFTPALTFALALLAAHASTAADRPRARDLGISPGVMQPGPLDAITDVPGVMVGQVTLVDGDRVRTGVTAILPHGGNLFRDKVPGGVFIGNAFGKLAGSTQVHELGTIETPIVLTNTLAVGPAIEGVVAWTLAQPGNEAVRSVNGLVGETNDGRLNDIRGGHVTREQVIAAIRAARPGAVEEGAVGAGTGTIAFGWKAGIGTASRRVPLGADYWTVGVLVQANFGGRLTIAGVPVWRHLVPPGDDRDASRDDRHGRADMTAPADGSCMIVVATDAPLDARNLERLAARAVYAMARTGSTYSNGSGDFAIAFSTQRAPRERLSTDAVSPLFEAVMDSTEEAIYNSLLRATDTAGNGHTARALPIAPLEALLTTRR